MGTRFGLLISLGILCQLGRLQSQIGVKNVNAPILQNLYGGPTTHECQFKGLRGSSVGVV